MLLTTLWTVYGHYVFITVPTPELTQRNYLANSSADTIHWLLQKLVEEFHRNPVKDADSDVACRTFAVADNHIFLKFHYAPGKITAATREFIKPPMMEISEKLTFNPELTAGYQVNSGFFKFILLIL
jgi:hypothetical protein